MFLVRQRPPPRRLAWLAGALAVVTVVTALRLRLGFGSSGVPLVFYLPAIIVVTLIAGWEAGIAAVVLSIAIVWTMFLSPPPSRAQLITIALWALVCALLVALAFFLRRALELLTRSEARYRKLVGVTSDVVWLTDGNGNVSRPHPAWTRATGMPWPDYSGRGWLDAVHEEDRAALKPAEGSGDHASEFRLREAGSGDWRWYRARAVALRDTNGEIEEWITAMRDVHEGKLARERDELVIGEARHRLKNLVTIIDALAKNSRRRDISENPELDAFLKRFLGRLHALGAAADLVLAGQHQYVEIGALVRATLAPFIEEGAQRFRIDGPPTTLSEPTGGSLALAMHELATNAIKYGALSRPEGQVEIGWSSEAMADGDRVTIEWKERGGPAAVAPEREGFGGRVIKSVPARERNGEVTIEYRPEGLYCRMEFVKNTKND